MNWRCADCVASGTSRPSAILEEFSKIHGKERMLLVRWSGYEMAENSLTYKDHLEADYTGLQAQLTRRRTELKEATPTGSIRQVYTRMQVRSNRRQKGSKVGHARTGPNSIKAGGRKGQGMTRPIMNGI